MQLDKLEAVHKTLEKLARELLIGDFDIKTHLCAIIVILNEMVDYEIEKQKVPTSPYT